MMTVTKADIEEYIRLRDLIENKSDGTDHLTIGNETSSYREYSYDGDYEVIYFPTWYLYGTTEDITADREVKRLEEIEKKERQKAYEKKYKEDKERAELERLKAKFGESQ